MNWYLNALRKYAVFEGRSSRSEYWYFILFNVLISFSLGFIDQMTGTFVADSGYGLLSAVYTLAVIIPGIAVSVRRLHDTDRSGFWFLITLIPLLGLIVFFYFAATDSDHGVNKYG
jgi:uncharacterized membrane protein YhaH (DUF805 family)